MNPKYKASFSVILCSALAPPIAYFVNAVHSFKGNRGLLLAGTLSLVVVCMITRWGVSEVKQHNRWLFYVFTLGVFSSSIDILIGLENDKLISNFLTNYLNSGEPYLTTAHGTMICYFDGICHYIMYMILLYRISTNKSYYEIGLYWAGSIGHSMIVFIPGNILGYHSIHPSILLNIPYIIFPFVCAYHFYNQYLNHQMSIKITHIKVGSTFFKMVFTFLFFFILTVCLFRGLVVLDHKRYTLFNKYITEVEPYLIHPDAYPKLQILVYLYYMLPMCIYLIISLNCSPVVNLNSVYPFLLLLAGASLQAQVTHIGASLRLDKTLWNFKENSLIFWIINLILLIVPQCFLLFANISKSSKIVNKIK